jgi:hypothetical protein
MIVVIISIVGLENHHHRIQYNDGQHEQFETCRFDRCSQ